MSLSRGLFAVVAILVGACGGAAAPPKDLPTKPASAPAPEAEKEAQEPSEPPPAAEPPAEPESEPCKDGACVKACDNKKTAELCEEARSYFERLSLDGGSDTSKLGENAAKELKYGKIACDLGSGFACTKAGDLTIAGFGEFSDKRKYPQSLALYEKGCDTKESFACHLAARQYVAGDGTKKDLVKAFSLETKRCAIAQFADMDCKDIRAAVGKKDGDALKAVDAARKKCKSGDALSCEAVKRIDTKK
jgi:TPR repeat protein